MSRYEAKVNINDSIYKVFSTPLFTDDIGNTVYLEFFMRGKPYTASNANVYKLMPDGKSASVAVAMKDNVCEFTIPNCMHSVPGETELQIALLDDDGNILTSGILHFDVLEGLSGKTQIAGTNEYNDMTALLSQMAESVSEVNKTIVKAENVIAKMSTVCRYKGSVKSYENLPDNPEVGDVYNIENECDKTAWVYPVTVAYIYEDVEDDTGDGSHQEVEFEDLDVSDFGSDAYCYLYDLNFNKITYIDIPSGS